MSSNIKVQRICQHCGNEFTARTTVTKFCGHHCARKAYKLRLRNAIVTTSDTETKAFKIGPIEEAKTKAFLTVKDVSILLNCSVRTIYRLITNCTIKAVNIGERKTLIQRSDIDRLFNQPQEIQPKTRQYKASECYNMKEIQAKFGVSEKALFEIIKRNNIQPIKSGKFSLVPKNQIEKIFK